MLFRSRYTTSTKTMSVPAVSFGGISVKKKLLKITKLTTLTSLSVPKKHSKQKAAQLCTRAGISMDDDIHLKDFYEWLDTYPNDVIKWEVTEVFEGVRYVRFLVREDEDE